MAVTRAEREIPWCALFLVTGAIVAHTIVLAGNLSTSRQVDALGQSTHGWADVGLGIGDSLAGELDNIMLNVTRVLTQSIDTIQTVLESLDVVLGLAGSVTDLSVSSYEREVAMHAANTLATNKTAANAKASLAQSQGRPATPVFEWYDEGAPLQTKRPHSGHRPTILEGDVIFMAQTELKQSASTHQPARGSGMDNLVPTWDQAGVGNLTTEVIRRIILIWREARMRDMKNITKLIPSPMEFKAFLKQVIETMVRELTGRASNMVEKFLTEIRPALLQIGEWQTTFGSKVQATITGFTTSLDNVQKLFDKVMPRISQTGQNEAQMLHNTYSLFDASGTGYISAQDLRDVAGMFGITGLYGSKANELFETYDTDNDGRMHQAEFRNFVHDESIPSAMAVVLRTYANKMAVISGNVAAARLRDEVAKAVVEYLALVCAKNLTKVSWVSQSLTNGSLPMAFTADILMELALNADSPDILTTVDTGALLIREMTRLNAEYVGTCLRLMSDPEFWSSEGFDPMDQAHIVERVTEWVRQSPFGWVALEAQLGNREGLLQAAAGVNTTLAQEQLETRPEMIKAEVERHWRQFERRQIVARRQRLAKQVMTPTCLALRYHFTEGLEAAAEGRADPTRSMTVSRGQPAAPETLRFAAYLARNSSATASRFQRNSFHYSGESSNALDSFANHVAAMVNKVQNFMNTMAEFSSPVGIGRLEQAVRDFATRSAGDVLLVVNESIDARLDEVSRRLPEAMRRVLEADEVAEVREIVGSAIGNVTAILEPFQAALGNVTANTTASLASPSLLQTGHLEAKLREDTWYSGRVAPDSNISLHGTWSELLLTMRSLQSALPTVVENVKFARVEVSATAGVLSNVFSALRGMAPPIFMDFSRLYRTIWVVYFVFYALLTASMLYYSLWASGWCGGPQAPTALSEDYERPRTFRERCYTCCLACDSCLRSCHDTRTCFWSAVILLQVIVLLTFVVSMVLCLLMGIKVFISAGCAEVHLLRDSVICSGVLDTVRRWMPSFLSVDFARFEHICDAKSLLTCQIVGSKMKAAALATSIGSLIAAVLSFEMIVEIAIMHERARWRRILDEESKRV